MNTEWIDRTYNTKLGQLKPGETFAKQKGGNSIWLVLQGDKIEKKGKVPVVELHSGQFELRKKSNTVIKVVPHHVGEEQNIMFKPE